MSSIHGDPSRLINHLSPDIEERIKRYFNVELEEGDAEVERNTKMKIALAMEQVIKCVNHVYTTLQTNRIAEFSEQEFDNSFFEEAERCVKGQLNAINKLNGTISTHLSFKTMGSTNVAYRVCQVTLIPKK